MADENKKSALQYHAAEPAGKLSIMPTKPMSSQHDLALAYSPGVAYPCLEIAEDAARAHQYTAKGNLVAVVSNGSAVLGLGNIGALASKPVMEGKAVLFKKFSGIDVFDLEVDASDPEKFVDVVAALEPTFGGINLEDIAAPNCFLIEQALQERMQIPVFHDDQHGTAIVAATALKSWAQLVGRELPSLRMICSGAGAAAIACLKLMVNLGVPRENMFVFDRSGLIHRERAQLPAHKAEFAQSGEPLTMEQAAGGAHVFLGLSGPGALSAQALRNMAARPLVLALANPTPEIMPEEAQSIRDDVIIATGRSDYPNQVNNVLCFPFIFRGALDCGATKINEAMKVACVDALSKLARAEPSEIVAKAYGSERLQFGPEYLIPKPLDPRLMASLAPAVAKAAMDSGVATRPIEDLASYRRSLDRFVYRSGRIMEPVLERARNTKTRIVFAEAEEPRVLRAVQQVLAGCLAVPILIGRPEVVRLRIEQLGLSLVAERDFELVNPESDPRFREYWSLYHEIAGRRGVPPAVAQTTVRGNNTVIGALMCRRGDAEGMICGTTGRFDEHLQVLEMVIGKSDHVTELATLTSVILPSGALFVCDPYISHSSPEAFAEMTLLAAREVRRFGVEPKVAFVSRSQFGSHEYEDATKLRRALAILKQSAPDLVVDGEMQVDSALSEETRRRFVLDSPLRGAANLLVMPSMDAANIAVNLLKELGNGVAVGPMMIGLQQPVNIVSESVSARGIVNMTAVTAVQIREQQEQPSDGRNPG